MREGKVPMLSIFMLAYNHEKFIREAIDSVLNQKVSFDYEIVIGEDCSKDNTRAILIDYQNRFPGKFHLILHPSNVGAIKNQNITLGECRGKYIALLEGDDYWVDEHKLQKQVDFLEQNPTFSLCFTDVIIKNEKSESEVKVYPDVPKDVLSLADVVERHYMATCTVLFRNLLPKPLPDLFYKARSGDITMEVFMAEKGLVKYLPHKTAVNRVHYGGITNDPVQKAQGEKSLFLLMQNLNELFEFKHKEIFRRKLAHIAKTNMVYGSGKMKGLKRLQNIWYWFPRYYRNQDNISVKEFLYLFALLFFPFILKAYQKQ